jgi:hypothetical protein
VYVRLSRPKIVHRNTVCTLAFSISRTSGSEKGGGVSAVGGVAVLKLKGSLEGVIVLSA